MSKKQFKSSASAARAFGTASPAFGFGGSPGFASSSSSLSYLYELPDLTSISDANVTVAFKNLSKRDATTKTKALEDLQTLLSGEGREIEDGVLEAWATIYPRTSIDSARRVRQLAHTLQGYIASKSGKRIAKRIPGIIGAWLAGLFDNDKGVARAASDALNQVFATAEKRQALWKAYQDPILEFCRNVFDNESPQTLSDERSISPDEASAKYFRVVTSALGLLSHLVSELAEADFEKNVAHYREIFQDKKLWEKSASEDAGVRRAVHKMLRGLLHSSQARSCLDFSSLSKTYLSKGLESDQTGSASEFLETMIVLTEVEGKVWTNLWQDKKPPPSRLKTFMKRGSQGSALKFWSSVAKLFRCIPTTALPSELEKAEELLRSLLSGVSRKDESRLYVAEGLKAYVQIASILADALPQTERSALFQMAVVPLVSQFVSPKADNVKWNIPPSGNRIVLSEIAKDKSASVTVVESLPGIASEIVRQIKLSLPEQASEYKKSQDELGKTGQRFADLVSTLTTAQPELTSSSALQNATAAVLRESLSVLVNRNGKPYGAAIVVVIIIDICRDLVDETESITSLLEVFLESGIAKIYVSPSYKQLSQILHQCEDQEELFVPAWDRCANAVFLDNSDRKYPALAELLICRTQVSEEDLHHLGPEIDSLVVPKLESIWTAGGSWDDLLQLLAKSTIASRLFGEKVLIRTNQALLGNQVVDVSTALEGIRKSSKAIPSVLQEYLATEDGKKLLPNLLFLSESSDESIAREASELIPLVQGLVGTKISAGASGNAVVDVIQDGLNSAGVNSVSIDTLVNHAKGLVSTKMVNSLQLLLPAETKWTKELHPFSRLPIDKSRDLTSELGGAVYLVDTTSAKALPNIERDGEGFSIPLRMMMYTIKLFHAIPDASKIASRQLMELLAWTVLLANDDVGIFNPRTSLWGIQDSEFVTEISDLVAVGLGIIEDWFTQSSQPYFKGDLDRSPTSYYSALLEAKLNITPEQLQTGIEVLEVRLKRSIEQNDIFSAVAQLYAGQDVLHSSGVINRQCNILVADLTVMPTEKLRDDGLPKLVLLNAILLHYDDVQETIAKPRLSRFMSKAISWLSDETVDDDIIAQIYRAMSRLLPLMGDMYGDYWKNILNSIKSNLELVSELPDENAPALIPVLYGCLNLYGVLRRIKSTEASKDDDEKNEDILEAWDESEKDMTTALINVLQVPRLVPDDQHQPLMIFNEIISREISRISTSKLSGVEALYSQLYSPSPAIQQAAYRVLHRYIPSQQEQISLDTALEKSSARLPDELLSLILEVPSAASFQDEDFQRSVPLQLRGYLLSWLLVFDHFTNASHKLKTDYVESMKEAGHLSDFLDFAFDFLGHGKGKPVDVSKFDVAAYNTSTMEDAPLKDTQWLITHLYFLTLTHFPSLAKAWWIECKSRAKVIAVESWTAKSISPLVISTALEDVVAWSITQDQAHTSEEPPALIIKINHRAHELSASYPMDDEGQSATIVVSLPDTFPLHNAKVTSPTKSMAVDERRWNAWLRNSQGIIAFSNNSIIDGLLAWRRNVFGALKGQTECAICYSVVGEDGRVPSKRCRTCKNSFHGVCLYKWFKSSNGTSCPLCREPFNYG